jgi:hypothetical protein
MSERPGEHLPDQRPDDLRDHERVFLPTRQICAGCHAPGHARSDCAECHRYHAIDQPPHGVGSGVRAAQMRKSAEQYMRRELLKPAEGGK